MHSAPLAATATAPNWSQRPVLRLGVTVGAGLCFLSFVWFILANRVPFFDRFSQFRNLAGAAIAVILLLVPVYRFLRSPGRLFLSGIIAWTMLALAYSAAELRFPALEERMGGFHLFVLGAIAYGLLATIIWVTRCLKHACQYPMAVRRRVP